MLFSNLGRTLNVSPNMILFITFGVWWLRVSWVSATIRSLVLLVNNIGCFIHVFVTSIRNRLSDSLFFLFCNAVFISLSGLVLCILNRVLLFALLVNRKDVDRVSHPVIATD